MKIRRYLPPTIWALAAILFLTCEASHAEDVKDFTLPSATDNSLIRLSDYSGKVVLINWWRSSCGWCQQETPKLVELYEKYRDDGLVVIGISDDTADTVGQVPAFIEHYGISYPVALMDQGEFGREIQPLGSGSTPSNYIVSRDGRIEFLGLMRDPEEDWQRIEEAVVRLLEQPEPIEPAIEPRELQSAADFVLEDLEGREYSLKDFEGRPLVVNFFTDGTGDWAGEVFSKLYEDYADRGLQVVGIHLFGDEQGIRDYKAKYDVEYPVLKGTRDVQRAWIGGSKGWATFFVTSDGKILKTIVDSIVDGLEGVVFSKYAEYLVKQADQQETSPSGSGMDAAGGEGTAWKEWHRRGLAYFEEGELQQAARAFSRAIELNPDHWRLWYDRAWARHGLNQQQQAIDDSNRALELNPDHWGPWGARGMSCFRLEQYEQTVDDLSQAIELGSDEDELYGPVFRLVRGTIYAQLGEIERGVADFQKAKELAPEAMEDVQLPGLNGIDQ